mgnify:CR=1 FL=1
MRYGMMNQRFTRVNLIKTKKKMSKKKLREWEIPMNLSDKEKKLYGMTTTHKLNNTAKQKHKCSRDTKM